uniref:Uncharacterized protein n=1 Tax=Utricularia reniformis TaxID=192314 RepID=A0A1Y0B2T4_9LAMI|nr:hypothetical protein AEK19_MT1492 [Utricularia reniformis]ART31683.1 hypothetical protein AEK19_MT1492 [Utricularia reniformis]
MILQVFLIFLCCANFLCSGFGIHAIIRKSQPLTSLLERVFLTSFPLSKVFS